MQPRLIALDLDGTLMLRRRGVSPGHRAVVDELRGRGIEVAIVTGRPLLATRATWEELELDNELVCFNGVWVGHPQREPLATAGLAPAETASVTRTMADFDGAICVYPDRDTWLLDRDTPQVSQWRTDYGVPIGVDARIREGFHGHSFKVMFVADPIEVDRALCELRGALGHAFHVVRSEADRLEVHRAHATKAWGLAELCAARGIPRAAVWACGDAANDLEMLAWAARGFAMGSDCAELLPVVERSLPPATEDGLRALLPLLEA